MEKKVNIRFIETSENLEPFASVDRRTTCRVILSKTPDNSSWASRCPFMANDEYDDICRITNQHCQAVTGSRYMGTTGFDFSLCEQCISIEEFVKGNQINVTESEDESEDE